MINKNTLISYSIVVLFFVVMIVSIFVDAPMFSDLTKILMLPTIIFSFSTILMNTLARIVRRFKVSANFYMEAIPDSEWILTQMKERMDFAVKENCDWKDEAVETFSRYDEKVKNFKRHHELLSKAIKRIEAYKIVKVLYVVSFALLLVCIALSPILVDFFDFVSLPFFSLMALTITVANAVLGDLIEQLWADWILEKVIADENQRSK